jgi:acetylglutamate kinase
MKTLKQKITTLIEALPYIQRYHGKIVVIKYGGNAMIRPSLKKSVITDIVLLKHVGINPIIVHGGGPDVNKAMAKEGMGPKFVKGLRVTDEKTMKIVEKVFEGINQEMCKYIKKAGGKSLCVSGRDHKLISVKQKDKALGFVGDIKSIHPAIITSVIKENYIPVVSPIGVSSDNEVYNINADTAASALAIALRAEKLTILTNVEGVYDGGSLISQLTIRAAKNKIQKGVIRKGMIPKVEACVEAVKNGCQKAHLIDGTMKHSLLLEIFTDKGVGTEIIKNEKSRGF